MSADLLQAQKLLHEHGYSCVWYHQGSVYTSKQSGIRPILEMLESGNQLQGFAVADKIVGKAAALLFVLAGAAEVHGVTMSSTALHILRSSGISASYELLTDCIKNRQGTGPCPMEQAVAAITKPRQALEVLRQTIEHLAAAAKASSH